ncbi:MAG: LamG-like jellyroll fold domain-containing protein, partial [Bacteroidia bacterium]
GLVGFWAFNNNANDQSINANNGVVNGATPTTDRFGNPNAAYNYNGSSDHIIVPNSASQSGFNDMSISAWINVNAFSGQQCVVAKWYQALNCGNNSDTYEACLVGSQMQFATNYNNIFAFSSPPSFPANTINTWQHVVFISNSTTGGSIYINGVLVATDPTLGTICNSTNSIYFGADYDGNWNFIHRYFNGKIDDIGIWNRVITPCEIQQLYTASAGGTLNATSSAGVSCPGMPVALSATGANTYTWSTGANGPVIVVSPTITTSYTVTGTNTVTGCVGTYVIVQTVGDCVGIKQNNLSQSISVYPNPTNGSVVINGLYQNTDVEVINALGEIIYQGKIEGNKDEIDLKEQKAGIYFIKIKTGQGTVIKKIIRD